ncbi:response regulator [Microbacterium paludicola]|uniref:Response regulator n=1 Tax=Microbacterium paludicola TaxID=300019 RepID=A0A4Y9FXK4_9MICO|nr:response regulator [Microbacterium paludicola]MBF0815271.1 response regulator [Microbacterium paludicola]TFU34139.1 response regulator [Microbacterium paludicola]
MAIARLNGGPLDGQVLPLETPDLEQLILPYSEGQLVYERAGAAANTGSDDGPTEVEFRFAAEPQEVTPGDDDVRPGE